MSKPRKIPAWIQKIVDDEIEIARTKWQMTQRGEEQAGAVLGALKTLRLKIHAGVVDAGPGR